MGNISELTPSIHVHCTMYSETVFCVMLKMNQGLFMLHEYSSTNWHSSPGSTCSTKVIPEI